MGHLASTWPKSSASIHYFVEEAKQNGNGHTGFMRWSDNPHFASQNIHGIDLILRRHKYRNGDELLLESILHLVKKLDPTYNTSLIIIIYA